MELIKFMYNGIKVNGELTKGHYSIGGYTTESKIKESTITFYAKSRFIPKIKGLNIENETDIQIDYFENSKIRITENNKFYKEVLEALKKQEEKRKNRKVVF